MKRVKINYVPHEQQRNFHDKKSKFRAFIGGVGSGKTLAGCQEAIKCAMTQHGAFGMIIAPTYGMLKDATRRTFFEACPRELISNFNKTDNHLMLLNTSEILFRSADEPERLRGPNLAWFYIDEAALVDEMTWKILVGRLRQKGMKHKAWITTTPKGYNWIYDIFGKSDGAVFCSSRDNPHLPDDFIADIEKTYTGAFAKQEIEGRFVGFEGLVYSNFDRNIHIYNTPKQFNRVIAGIDRGFTNPTAIVVIGIDNDDNYHVIDEFYEKNVLVDDLVRNAQILKEKHNIDVFYCDPSEPGDIVTLRRNGISAKAGNNKIVPGISAVCAKLPKVHSKCTNTIIEFENYRYPDTKSGKPAQENPIKIYDHAMDAIRYAIHTHQKTVGDFKIIGDLDGTFGG